MRAVAFLRGLNVGGHRVTNEELAESFASLGYTGVGTFLASGNVLFDLADAPDAAEGRLAEGLEARMGYAVPAFVRTAEQVRAIAALRPFSDEVASGKPQVLLLRDTPSVEAAHAVEALAPEGESLAVVGRELHWLPRSGISDSELDLVAVERLVGVGTMRTRRTVERLVAKL